VATVGTVSVMDELTVQHGPAWTPTADRDLITQVARTLAVHGGRLLLPPADGDEADAEAVVARGELCDLPVEPVGGAPNSCHENAARWVAEHGGELWCGYALAADGMWRPHSWAVADATIRETTVVADRYFGCRVDDAGTAVAVAEAVAASAPGAMCKLSVELPDDAMFGSESMWAERLDDGTFRVANVPFFAGGFTVDSVVTATGGQIDGVVSHAYASVATVRVPDGVDTTELLAGCTAIDVRVEGALPGLWAAAIPEGRQDDFVALMDAVDAEYAIDALPTVD
jgi:hypothetical protein